MSKEAMKLVANNKKAYHDYFVDEKIEAGLVLHGTEVKSLRMGKCSIKESFIRIENGEMFVYGMHISPYEKGNIFNKDPLRVKKLLLHKSEINKMTGKIKEKGFTIVPLQVYFQDGFLTKVTNEDGSKIESITDPDGKTVKIDKVSFRYDEVTLSGKDGFEIKMTLNKDAMTADGTGYKTDKNLQLNLTGIGSITLQIGANEDQTLELRMPPITKKNLGLSHTDVLTEESANAAIDEIADAISFVSSIRSSLGAYQNRLEHTTTNLDVTSENMTSAYSRIMDVDMATEMTKYSSLQVISQAATSMLAQANERPSQVLQLLQ